MKSVCFVEKEKIIKAGIKDMLTWSFFSHLGLEDNWLKHILSYFTQLFQSSRVKCLAKDPNSGLL